MATVPVDCRYCQSASIYKHGYARSGEPRYRCRDCQRSFQLYYHNVGNRDGIPEKIVEMAINGSGVRDTSRDIDGHEAKKPVIVHADLSLRVMEQL